MMIRALEPTFPGEPTPTARRNCASALFRLPPCANSIPMPACSRAFADACKTGSNSETSGPFTRSDAGDFCGSDSWTGSCWDCISHRSSVDQFKDCARPGLLRFLFGGFTEVEHRRDHSTTVAAPIALTKVSPQTEVPQRAEDRGGMIRHVLDPARVAGRGGNTRRVTQSVPPQKSFRPWINPS